MEFSRSMCAFFSGRLFSVYGLQPPTGRPFRQMADAGVETVAPRKDCNHASLLNFF